LSCFVERQSKLALSIIPGDIGLLLCAFGIAQRTHFALFRPDGSGAWLSEMWGSLLIKLS